MAVIYIGDYQRRPEAQKALVYAAGYRYTDNYVVSDVRQPGMRELPPPQLYQPERTEAELERRVETQRRQEAKTAQELAQARATARGRFGGVVSKEMLSPAGTVLDVERAIKSGAVSGYILDTGTKKEYFLTEKEASDRQKELERLERLQQRQEEREPVYVSSMDKLRQTYGDVEIKREPAFQLPIGLQYQDKFRPQKQYYAVSYPHGFGSVNVAHEYKEGEQFKVLGLIPYGKPKPGKQYKSDILGFTREVGDVKEPAIRSAMEKSALEPVSTLNIKLRQVSNMLAFAPFLIKSPYVAYLGKKKPKPFSRQELKLLPPKEKAVVKPEVIDLRDIPSSGISIVGYKPLAKTKYLVSARAKPSSYSIAKAMQRAKAQIQIRPQVSLKQASVLLPAVASLQRLIPSTILTQRQTPIQAARQRQRTTPIQVPVQRPISITQIIPKFKFPVPVLPKYKTPLREKTRPTQSFKYTPARTPTPNIRMPRIPAIRFPAFDGSKILKAMPGRKRKVKEKVIVTRMLSLKDLFGK